jgi:hypothetical protein
MPELNEALKSGEFLKMKNVRVCGVMGIATYSTDKDLVRTEFSYLKECFNLIQCNYYSSHFYFKEISMGMSGDYDLALKEGSTMVRIGSLIFGERI